MTSTVRDCPKINFKTIFQRVVTVAYCMTINFKINVYANSFLEWAVLKLPKKVLRSYQSIIELNSIDL